MRQWSYFENIWYDVSRSRFWLAKCDSVAATSYQASGMCGKDLLLSLRQQLAVSSQRSNVWCLWLFSHVPREWYLLGCLALAVLSISDIHLDKSRAKSQVLLQAICGIPSAVLLLLVLAERRDWQCVGCGVRNMQSTQQHGRIASHTPALYDGIHSHSVTVNNDNSR